MMPKRIIHLTNHLAAALAITLACTSCEEKARIQADTAALQSQTQELQTQLNHAEAEASRLERALRSQPANDTSTEDQETFTLQSTKEQLETEIAALRSDLNSYRQRNPLKTAP